MSHRYARFAYEDMCACVQCLPRETAKKHTTTAMTLPCTSRQARFSRNLKFGAKSSKKGREREKERKRERAHREDMRILVCQRATTPSFAEALKMDSSSTFERQWTASR